MPLEEALANLDRAATELQLETEVLNAGIAAFNERLAKIGLGVTVWLATPLVFPPERKEWSLGYARVSDGGKLALAARQGEADPMALIHAPRHVRVASVELLEDLVAALVARTQECADQVRAALARFPQG